MGRRYYKKRTVVVRPKKRWASNMVQLVGQLGGDVIVQPTSVASSTHFVFSNTLCENKAQAGSPTPVILKCGNFKLKGDMRLQMNVGSTPAPTFAGCVAYIMYVPEGVSPGYGLIGSHPEWIMAWSPIDVTFGPLTSSGTSTQQVEKFSMSSRLKRNLNSGDQVVLILDLLFTPAGGATVVSPTGIQYLPSIMVQYWTCAN